MRCLTLHQPWATLIMLGSKRYETRSWSTPYRGPLIIHAGKTLDREALDYFVRHGFHMPKGGLSRGALLGTVRMTDCRICDPSWTNQLDMSERRYGDFMPGRFAWELTCVHAWDKPVTCRGFQGLWKVPGDIALPELAGGGETRGEAAPEGQAGLFE